MKRKEEIMNQINFQITGNCNMNCEFCCDAVSYQKESSIEMIKKTIDRLVNQELKRIHITGGEPLLYSKLTEVLSYMKEQNLEISLSTNGTLLSTKKEILPFIDEIVLPLDGISTKTLVNLGREKDQRMNRIKNIYMIKEKFPQLKIKISTVMNSQNINELPTLIAVINQLPIDEWEVHQFLPHGKGKKNIQKFLLDDNQFEKVSLFLQTTSIAEKITLVPISQKIRTEWTITPALYLIQLKEEKPVFYGKIDDFSDFSLKEIVKKPIRYLK